MCVKFCCPSSEPGKPHHPVLWIVTLVKFWHAIGGLYMWVFTIFLYVTQPNPSCPAGNTSLPSTMNGELFEAVSLAGGRHGFVHFSLVSFSLLCP